MIMTYSGNGDSGKTESSCETKIAAVADKRGAIRDRNIQVLEREKEDRPRNRECRKARACGCVDTDGPRDSGLRHIRQIRSCLILSFSSVKRSESRVIPCAPSPEPAYLWTVSDAMQPESRTLSDGAARYGFIRGRANKPRDVTLHE